MRLRPLTGNVLIELVRDRTSPGGVSLPEHTLSPEEQQERAHHPTPPGPVTGVVREIGPWPKLKNGMAQMPPFGVGAKVLIPRHCGFTMGDGFETFRMMAWGDVLAVLT